jgi:hypothetical protein
MRLRERLRELTVDTHHVKVYGLKITADRARTVDRVRPGRCRCAIRSYVGRVDVCMDRR